MGLFLPQTRTRRPPYRSELLLSNPLNRALCFASVSDSAQGFDLVSRSAAPLKAADSYAPSQFGPAWQFTVSNANSGLDFGLINPITTSDGTGGGDFTILAIGNPTATGNVNTLFDQRHGSGSFEQIGLFANSDKGLSASSGVFALFTQSTGAVAAGAQSTASQVDGSFHVWVGRRSGTAHSIWRDGIDVTGSSDTSANTLWASSQKLEVGAAADLSNAGFGSNCSMVLALAWNRALSNYEMGQMGRNPWQILKATQPRFYFAGGAGGGATFNPGWATGATRTVGAVF